MYRRLLDWRKRVAVERHLPASYIMPLRTVIAITNTAPADLDELLDIPGVGPKTASEYGADLLALVRESLQA